jgi:crotonobetainyl-CoA:carnitine CoA-transferase CaiB-like acyl-CoA transferase
VSTNSSSTIAGPLNGLTVLDLSSVVLGPMASQYLGDMGADVIKIEPPEGDVTRMIGPRRSDKMGALFLANNRNKRSVVLDLKTPAGKSALLKLSARCDVLMHSIRSSAANRIGLSYEALSASNPRMVYCHLLGFSDAGLYGGKPAYDDIVQALSGLAMLQTVVGGEPRYMPAIFADKVTAVHAAYAIMLALFHRERTGQGQKVAVPMLETMVAFNSAEHLGGQIFEPPVGEMGYAPVRQGMRRPFKTKDGYLCFMPYTDGHWREFALLTGNADLANDPTFMTMKGRQANIERVWAEVGRQLLNRTNDDWLSLCAKSDIPIAVVNSLEDLLTDPHLESVGFWRLLEHRTEGTLRFPANPLELSATPPSIRRPPPHLGEHTTEVLREFGCAV